MNYSLIEDRLRNSMRNRWRMLSRDWELQENSPRITQVTPMVGSDTLRGCVCDSWRVGNTNRKPKKKTNNRGETPQQVTQEEEMLHRERKGKVIMNSASINRRVKAFVKRGSCPITRKINLKVYRHVMDYIPFKDGNTQLTKEVYSDGVAKIKLFLHGNMIGCIRIDEKKHTIQVTASDCGWATPTTVSRLNAFLQGSGCGYVHAGIVDGETYFANSSNGMFLKNRFDSNDL